MGNILSPAVEVREFDYSLIVPAVATSRAGYSGKFNWGPVFEKTQVASEMDLLNYFRGPANGNFIDFFTCAEFLRYGKSLWIVRAVDPTTAKNAGITVNDEDQVEATKTMTSALYIPNSLNIPTDTFGANEKLHIVARYPGTLGNSIIKVSLATADDFASAEIQDGLTFAEVFDYAPISNAYDYYDQLAICVQVKNITDNNWQIVEKWLVDLDPNAKNEYNKSNYIENVINNKSNWIYVFDNASNAKSPKSFEATLLESGIDGTPDTGDIIDGYDLFANPEEFDVNILIDGANNNETVQSHIVDICDTRMDCMGVLSIPEDEMVGIALSTAISNCLTYRNTTLNKNSTYAAIYANAKYIYDKYNDVYRWIPISGDMAGIYARTDHETETWYAPMGLTRGQIKNCLRLAIAPTKAYRDTLYTNSINPVVGFPGEGNVVWGQKTMTNRPTAFGRINVRRLFIVLEKSIATAAKYMIGEFNDAFQRNLFKLMVDPYLKRVQGKRGITEYFIICDETNNTAQVIDSNEFVGDIYIKPARTIEGIYLNFIATPTGTSFNEIIRPL